MSVSRFEPARSPDCALPCWAAMSAATARVPGTPSAVTARAPASANDSATCVRWGTITPCVDKHVKNDCAATRTVFRQT